MFFRMQECNELIDLYKPLSKFDNEDIKYYSFLDIDPNKFKYDYKINYLLDEYVKQYQEAGKTTSIWFYDINEI